MKFNSKKNRTNGNKIEDTVYDNNLYFYTILKTLVQCGLSDNKYIQLQSVLDQLKTFYKNDAEGMRTNLLASESIVKNNTKARSSYDNLISLIENDKLDMWLDMMDIGIDLLLFKDMILQEAKAYTTGRQQLVERKIVDHLSIAYDTSHLCLPYGQRVLSSLLVFSLTDMSRKTEFLLSSSNVKVKQIAKKVCHLSLEYDINCNSMLILIVDESVAQSIKSSAGSSYEDRVEYAMRPLVDNWKGHSHDENVRAMEYDFTFELDGKRAGISAKRTLRERYKQNHENIGDLCVDCIFVFTLGTDLNRDKLDSLLQKDKNYVVVADEIYNSKQFLKESPRVFSSKNLTREKLLKIVNL